MLNTLKHKLDKMCYMNKVTQLTPTDCASRQIECDTKNLENVKRE